MFGINLYEIDENISVDITNRQILINKIIQNIKIIINKVNTAINRIKSDTIFNVSVSSHLSLFAKSASSFCWLHSSELLSMYALNGCCQPSVEKQ